MLIDVRLIVYWSMSEVGLPLAHILDKPHAIVAVIQQKQQQRIGKIDNTVCLI